MCDTIELLEAIGDLTGSFRPPPTDVETRGFITALEGIPVSQVKQAVRYFLQGTVAGYNPKFCPSPPQLAEEARRIGGGRHPHLVVLRASDPDFVAIEKLRGKRPITGGYGTTTVRKSEIEKARKALSSCQPQFKTGS